MKKFLLLLSVFLLFLGTVGNAQADDFYYYTNYSDNLPNIGDSFQTAFDLVTLNLSEGYAFPSGAYGTANIKPGDIITSAYISILFAGTVDSTSDFKITFDSNSPQVSPSDFNSFGSGYGGLLGSDVTSYLDDLKLNVDVTANTNNGMGISGIAIGGTYESSAPVPEPATMLLLGTGLVGLAGFRKKFKKA